MSGLLVVISSYLLGSISFGYWVAKYKKIDLRQFGSGNLGTTNAFRVLGPGSGVLVFVGDFFKGYLSACLGAITGGESLAVMAGLASMAGHSYPIFLNFKGGKVIATGVGVLMAFDWRVGLLAIVIWATVLAMSRYVSLASILAAIFVPVLLLLFQSPLPYLIFGLVGATFAVYKHIPNIKRLRAGTEFKVGQKKRKEDRLC